MSLFELCIRRPVLSTVLSVLVLVIGLISYSRLAVREYPKIDEPVVSVSTGYPGASADVIESQITKVLEDSLAGIEGVELLTSFSRAGTQQHQRPLPHHPRPGFGGGRRARQGCARAGTPAGQRRRAGDLESGGRLVPGDLDGGDGRQPHAARGVGLPEPLRQAAPVGAAGRGRCLDLRRAQDVDAHQRRPRPARRLPPDTGRRRGRAAAAEHRAAVRSHRIGQARVLHRRVDRCQHARTVRKPDRRDLERLSGEAARRCRYPCRPGRGTRHRPLPGRAVDQHGPGQAGHGQSARTVPGAARRSGQDQRDAARRHEDQHRLRLVRVHRTLDQVGVHDDRRGRGSGRAGHLLLPAQPARHADPAGDDPGVAGRCLCADVRVRLHDQHADAAGHGAGDRSRGRRCDRRAGEHLPQHRKWHGSRQRRGQGHQGNRLRCRRDDADADRRVRAAGLRHRTHGTALHRVCTGAGRRRAGVRLCRADAVADDVQQAAEARVQSRPGLHADRRLAQRPDAARTRVRSPGCWTAAGSS